MDARIFSIKEALRFGWETFKRNIGACVVLGVVSIGVMLLFEGGSEAMQRHGPLALGFTILSQLVQTFFAFVWVRLALTVHDGQAVRARELFPDAGRFLNYLAVSILYGLLVSAGLVLLLIPGIYLAVRYGLATFLVADARTDVLGAFRESAELTRGARWHLLAFGLVLLVLNAVGAIMFAVGLLLTVPISVFAAALVYRRFVAARAGQEPYLLSPQWPAPA